ncbi:MAG TPA: glycosyltransferase family 2 protein [Gemmataceae bacterium]|nr:glycosyltransferase family 2 protein [Gemmataceae bacterium]
MLSTVSHPVLDEVKSEPIAAPPIAPSLELSVVMPCLNEARTVGRCVEKALRTMRELGIAGEVVVSDNGSTDDSVTLAEQAGARVVHQPLKGYGNALRKGFAEARGRYIIMGDCDDSYDFTDLKRFVDRLRAGADLVMGNRFAGEIKPGAMPWLHRWIGNPILTRFLNLLFRTGVGDTHCGLRGFRKDAVQRMNLHMPGMELASEMVIKSARAGQRIEEVPITLWPDGRDRPPHLRSFRDGWRHLRFMLMCCPTFLFLLPGLTLLLLGLIAIPAVVLAGYGVFTTIFGPNFMYTASLASITGAHVVAFGLLAKLYAHQVDPVFRDPRIESLARLFSVERGLLLGVDLILAALALGLPVVTHWWSTSAVPVPGQWIFAGTLFMLGLEAVFVSFLKGVFELQYEDRKTG